MASHHEKPFLVERQEAVLVRPSYPSPSVLLPLSTIDNDPNLELICQTVYVYTADGEDPAAAGGGEGGRGSDFLCQQDPTTAIQEGLSKALVYYYPLAGRLRRHADGKLRVDCTGEGVPFSPATASCTLASLRHLDGIDVETAKQLVFRPEDGSTGGAGGACPLIIQVTRFACGGFTVGMGLSHSVCDGFGSGQFLRAVAELAGGKVEPSVKPVWERARLAAPAMAPEQDCWKLLSDDGPPSTSPHLPSSDLVHACFNVGSSSITSLKKSLQSKINSSDGGGDESFTTLEALGAFVWRSRFRALDMNPEGKTHFSLAVGIRSAVNPPLPEGYYGNAFVGSLAVLHGRDLCEGPLSDTAAAIRESKKQALEAEYIASYLGMKERMNVEGARLGGDGTALVVTDWRRLGLVAAGFGGRAAVNVVPLPWDMFGYVDLCIFMPAFGLGAAMEGGVRVLVCLPRAAMGRFGEEMASLPRLPQGKV